ncbi:MAG: hypothetical protein AAFU55_02660 [Pseudomonadota bacterium]
MNELDVSELVGICRGKLREQGFEIEQVVNTSYALDIISQMEKPYQTRHLSSDFHDFSTKNSFWMMVKKEEEYVGCVGVRWDDIGDEPIVSWWNRQGARLYGVAGQNILLEAPIPRFMSDVRGRLVYIGDLFLITRSDVTRRLPLRSLMFLVYSISYMRWEVDWIYSFIKDKHAKKGFPAIYAASHQYPGVQRWRNEPAERDSSEWFTCSSVDDFKYLAGYYYANSDLL